MFVTFDFGIYVVFEKITCEKFCDSISIIAQ